jgi:phosphoglycerate dehydrogenase-like enzyme
MRRHVQASDAGERARGDPEMALKEAVDPRGTAPRGQRQPLEIAVHADLPQSALEQIRAAAPHVRVTTKAELVSRPELLAHAEVLFTQSIDATRIAQAANLRWVQTYGAGVEWLLTDAVVARDELRITNARGIHAQPIAEHVFGMLLAFTRRIDGSVRQQQTQAWQPAELTASLRNLDGKTLGIVGLGAIGRRLAEVGKAFAMRVIGTRSSGAETPSVDRTYGPDGLRAVLAESDYIVNALPLTAATRHVFNRETLAVARPDAVLINIGRGATIDTEALVEALKTHKLGAALLDVTDPEPLPKEHALWRLPNVLITPHYAGAHPGYAQHVTALFLDNLKRYLTGDALINLVDKRAGY